MKISENGLNLIKQFEGCVLSAYKDAGGTWTIGYGHTNGVKSGMKITQSQANEYLLQDVAIFEKHVEGYDLKYDWTQNEFDALVSFAFNIGSIQQLTATGTRTKSVIAEKMLLYTRCGGKELEGLVKRRKAEHDLFLKDTQNPPIYKINSTYTTQVELIVRTGAGTIFQKVGYFGLTENGKLHDSDKDGAIDKGTRVTCKAIKYVGSDIWIQIPSGWIAGYYKGKVFVK